MYDVKISNMINPINFQGRIINNAPKNPTKTANSDTVEISDTARDLQNKVVAISGKDTLNGNKIALSDDVKQNLSALNNKVEQANERSYLQAIAKHESAVAKSAELTNKHKRHNDDDVSRQNELARAKENQPQDYSTDFPEYQRFETQMSLDSEFQVQSINATSI